MKIVFFPVECCPFHGLSLEERPLGGTETGVIRLAEALDGLDQEVYVVTQEKDPPATKPRYITPQMVHHLGLLDALIIVRGWKGAFLPFEAKTRLFWTGDAWTNTHTFGIGDLRFINKIDALLAVSQWHAETLCRSSGFPAEKAFLLRNGIHAGYFAAPFPRKLKRLIYSSAPNRGLKYLPSIFQALKKRHPDLEMRIFSSNDRYAQEWPPVYSPDGAFDDVFDRLSRLSDVVVEGSVGQRQLAQEFLQASIWAYPTDFEETSCITALEAQAAGCAIVTTALAALPETVGDAGCLIQGDPSSENYQREFIDNCDRLLSDESLFSKYSQKGMKRAQNFAWKQRGEEFLDFLRKTQGLD